ncbi:hypothetical protein IV102_29475 [bacterium]|nr:hypothetical protein [bacterium]
MRLLGLAALTGLATATYNYLSGRNLLADSWDQARLVSQPLDYWESIWRKRPPTRVVACLTTIPSRLPHLELTFKSLLYQSWGLQKIRLHLPQYSEREGQPYIVPEHWLGRDWLEIVTCPDFGPATKLLPALQDLPGDQRLLVVDDDMLYPATLVQFLLGHAQRNPDWVVASSGWRVPAGLVDRPTTLWDNLARRSPAPVKCTRVNHRYPVDIVQGYSGFLTQPDFYDKENIFDYSQAPAAARWVDDVWLSAHCLMPKAVFPAPRYCFERWKARKMMKAASLGRLNRGDGTPLTRNNTIAIRHLQEHWLHALPEGRDDQNPNALAQP